MMETERRSPYICTMAPVLKRLLRIAPELGLRTVLIAFSVMFIHGIASAAFNFEVPWGALLVAAGALWVPMAAGLYIRAGEPAFRPWRKLDRRQQLSNLAGALWMTPMVLLFPLWVGLFYEPSAVVEYWDLYALFFGLPFAAAALLYFYSARIPSS